MTIKALFYPTDAQIYNSSLDRQTNTRTLSTIIDQNLFKFFS